MRRPEDVAIALSYVDECLAPSAIPDFERRLADDADLKADVALWKAQNDAIRRAFARRSKVADAPVALAAFANRDHATVRRGAERAASNVTHFPKAARRVDTRAALDVRAPPMLARICALASLAFALALISANSPPPRDARLRDEAARAWTAYRGDAVRPPTAQPAGRGARTRLDALLADAFTIPSDLGPAQLAFDVDAAGRRFLALVSPADAPGSRDAGISLQQGGTSALWSDGRRWITVFGESDATATAAEAVRLRSPP